MRQVCRYRAGAVPEGDTVHRAARRLQILVGERIEATSPHPRAQAARVAEQIDGRRLESVTAHGKNIVLRFEGGVVVRSHLRMTGRWTVRPRGQTARGAPWLVLRGARAEGVLWNGPVLELHTRALAALGPDILEQPPRFDAMLARLHAADGTRWFGESLLDQRLVSGIGNMWRAEALWVAELSPWQRLSAVGDDARRAALETAAAMMRASVDGARVSGHQVYRRVGRPCPRCRTQIRSYGQGDANRMTYWCPRCQRGTDPPGA
jgi:endonuclease-8